MCRENKIDKLPHTQVGLVHLVIGKQITYVQCLRPDGVCTVSVEVVQIILKRFPAFDGVSQTPPGAPQTSESTISASGCVS